MWRILLLFGELPDKWQLEEFRSILCDCRRLPEDFTRDVIMKGATSDLMNSMAKSVLSLASYDPSAMDISVPNVLRQCLQLISVFPLLAIYGYQAYNHYLCDDSLYIHRPDPQLSTAENMLRLLRPDCSYTETEAHVLDAALILHMEHGGGNNSTFTTPGGYLCWIRYLFRYGCGIDFSERTQAWWSQYKSHGDDERPQRVCKGYDQRNTGS